MTTLRDIGEDALIERLVNLVPQDPSPMAGPGDDCAAVDPGASSQKLILLKTDALVENIHFLTDAPPRAVGWKAAARVISDFAAMGGEPERFLITLALPASTKVTWVEELYRGIGDCLNAYGGVLAGGETSGVPAGSAAVISIAATGSVRREEVVLRSTARPGDVLLVTGRLGGSIHGRHLDFKPRLFESRWLATHHKPTAMMDLSDGLGKDLPRLALASGCGFEIDFSMLPLMPGCTAEQALGDGEDYELLLAIEPHRADALTDEWRKNFPELPLGIIGNLLGKGAEKQSLTGGWEHFAQDSDAARMASNSSQRL
jgi:thiamine-monophosphate kinase